MYMMNLLKFINLIKNIIMENLNLKELTNQELVEISGGKFYEWLVKNTARFADSWHGLIESQGDSAFLFMGGA